MPSMYLGSPKYLCFSCNNMHDVSLLVSWKTCGFKSYVSTKFWLVLTTKLKQNFCLTILKLNYVSCTKTKLNYV